MVWLDRSGGLDGQRTNLTRRVMCDDCTPDQEKLERQRKRISWLIYGIVALVGAVVLGCAGAIAFVVLIGFMR